LAAVGISLVGAALRIQPLGESLWLDELHTAWCAVGPLDEVAQRAAMGNQGPLFYWLEWLTLRLLGPNELSLRLISLLSASLLPLAVFLLARRWRAETAGLVAAGLIAVDPLSIFYATEARPYATLQLLAVLHVALTTEVVEQPTLRRRMTWIGVAVAMFYLHFTAALVIFAEATVLCFSRIVGGPEKRGSALILLVDFALLGVLCLPELSNLQAIFAHRANWATFVARGPVWSVLEWFSLPAWWWSMLVVMAVVGVGCQRKSGASGTRRLWGDASCLLVAAWLAIPLGLAWLATWTDTARLFFPRYVVCSLPAAALVAGLFVRAIPWQSVRIVAGVLTIACAAWSGGLVENIVQDNRVIAPRGEDWRGCVAWLDERLPEAGFPVLVYSGLIEADELRQPHDELLADYCLAPVTSLYPLDVDRGDMFPLALHEPGKLDQVAEMLMIHRGGAWLIVRGDKPAAARIAEEIMTSLRAASVAESSVKWRGKESQSFGRV